MGWLIACGIGWGAAVVWALHERYGRKLAEDRLTVRERIATDWRDEEPVILKFPGRDPRRA
jgi:hypothetical protein